MTPDRLILITRAPARHGAPDDFVGCPPVALVHVGCESNWTAAGGAHPKHNGKHYLALIDTGADGTAIDKATAEDIEAAPVGEAVVSGMSGVITSVAGADIQIIFPQANVVFEARAAILNLREAGQTFNLILGRSFLQHCKLVMDGPLGLFQLQWVD